jgi:2-dehydropantoate 2-reductase
VKTFDLAVAGHAVRSAFESPPPVLLPQNGLSAERVFAPDPPAEGDPSHVPVVRAVNSVPVTLLGPGRVRQAGEGEILLARTPPVEMRAATTLFRDALAAAGFQVREVTDLPREVWRKALVNAAVNPVTADHGVLNGRLSEDPWRGQALALLHEARQAAGLAGFEFTEEEAEADLFRVVRATAENRSSMLQDLERGRPTEIDAISGEILAVGARHGVDLLATRRAIDRTRAHVAQRDRQRTP